MSIKKKQYMSMLMLLIMLINFFALEIFANSMTKINDKANKEVVFIYEDEEKTIIKEYKGEDKEVEIPEGVKIIRRGAFKNKGIENLVLNQEIEYIEAEAFSNNKIKELTLLNSLIEISERAFQDNEIEKIDFSNISKKFTFKDSAFQDNKIKEELDLSSYHNEIPKKAFWNNEIKEVKISDKTEFIHDEAFAVNKLSKVVIGESTDLGKNVFASNGRFVEVYTKNDRVLSEKSSVYYNYGHIVNPVNIIVKSLEPVLEEGKETGRYKKLLEDKEVKFDPRNPDNIFALNDTSFYKVPDVLQYELKNKNVKNGVISFVPDKNNYELNLYYEKIPNPKIIVNPYNLEDLLAIKKEGDTITENELLSLVYALDYKDRDISKNIKVAPKELVNVDAKEYEVIYTVMDGEGLTNEMKITLPIAMDPLKIPVGDSEWVLGDFVYSGNEVIALSEEGKKKAKLVGGIAIPHINPYTMETIKRIGFSNLYEDITEGPLYIENPEQIEAIGYSAFENTPLIGEIPSMPNLKSIDSSAFKNTQITGDLKSFKSLEKIGYSAFENSSLNGVLEDLPSLKKIESLAFKGTSIKKLPDKLNSLEEVGDSAFQDVSTLSGQFPITPNLKTLAYGAFQGTSLSGEIRNLDSLEIMGDSAFQNTNISGSLPKLPKLKELRGSSLANTQIEGPLPDMPEVVYIGQTPFSGVISLEGSTLPKMPKVEIIEYGAFSMLGLVGEFDKEYPNLKTLGVMVFYGNNLEGDFPKMPQIEEIQDWAFNGLNISGSLGEMPELRVIGTSAFYGTQISGEFPKTSKLERLGDTIFTGSNLEIKEPITTNNNNITIEERAFEDLDKTNYPVIIFTENKEDAPGVKQSDYHVLNPYSIEFIGKTKEGKILKEERILARKSGDNIIFDLPRVMGYKSPPVLTIKESEIIDGVYEYEYERIENNKNDYEFEYISEQNKGFYAGNEVINTLIKFNTINNKTIEKGIIDVYYNGSVYCDFYVPMVKSVKEVEYHDEYVRIILDENIVPGTDLEIPVSFKIKEGTIPETLFDIEAELNDFAKEEDRLKGHGKLSFGAIYVDPVYKSQYYTKEDEFRIGETVKDLDKDYEVSVELFPETDQFIRDFKKVRIEYDQVEFKNKFGNMDIANIHEDAKDWKFEDGKYVYEIEDNIPGDLSELNIPALKLNFKNPATTLKFIEIDSRIKADINTELEDFKYFTMDYKNYLFIHVAEEGPYSMGKAISVPHYEHPQYSYFYDNVRERKSEFIWRLYYSTGEDIDSVILNDYNLDERMKYTGINPKEEKTLVNFYNKNDERILTKTITEFYRIEEDIQEDIKRIEMIYNGNGEKIDLSPEIITELIDKDVKQYDEKNEENNDYWNEYKVEVNFSDGRNMTSIDKAKTTVKPDNKNLATEVKVNTKTENLTYGKIANTDFYLRSKEFIDMDVRELKYTALINEGQRVEDVVIPDNLKASYEIVESYNNEGITKIDFIFEDINISLKDYKDRQKIVSIKTTPENKQSLELKPIGLLSPSDDYLVYDTGIGSIGEIDYSHYAYSEDNKKIINGSYFTLYKKIVDKDGKTLNSIKSEAGDKFFYRFEIDNATNQDRMDLELIDILPFNQDFNGSEYSNMIDLDAIKNIQLPKGFSIEYLNQKEKLLVEQDRIIEELSNKEWATEANQETKAIRIKAEKIEPQDEALHIDIPMITNPNLSIYDNGKENHNTFAFKYKGMTDKQALSNKVSQKIEMEVPFKDIKLKKISTFKKEKDGVIKGVEFILRDKDRNFIASKLTDENGELVFENIEAGDYTIEEARNLPGYKDDLVKISIKLEDMLNNKNPVIDLGEVINERIEEYPLLIKNVEYSGDLDELDYENLKDLYNRTIKSGEFEILKDGEIIEDFKIDNRDGLSLILEVGKYEIREKNPPKDNGVNYETNPNSYYFEIDKLGKLYIFDKNMNKIEENRRIVYFPHKVDPSFSNINIFKIDMDKKPLAGAKFQLTNSANGEALEGISDDKGLLSFKNIPSGLYVLEEIEAPEGYLLSSKKEIIDVPLYEDKEFDFVFINKKLKLNIHKYKIVKSNLNKEEADLLISELNSNTGGRFIKKEIYEGLYEVREVWEDNDIKISTKKEELVFKTDHNGSILNVQDKLINNIDSKDFFTIINQTEIPGHYQDINVKASVEDYQRDPNFDGTIDIDLIVKPLEGSIFVSRYVLDKNTQEPIKGLEVNGSKYTLYVDKGNGYQYLEEKEITNGDFLVFDKLDPNNKYKVVESFTPEGQKESIIKEQEVELTDYNRYTETVIFRNYKMEKTGSLKIKKIDGDTKEVLKGAEFILINKDNEAQSYITNEKGEINIEEIELDKAEYQLIEIRAPEGYRLNTKSIRIKEEDLRENKEIIIENFRKIEVPETGTLNKIPFITLSIVLILLSIILRKRRCDIG